MFQFSIDSQQFRQLEIKLKKRVMDSLAEPALMIEIGDFVVERLKFQARTAQPFNGDKSFPALKPNSITNRNYLAKHNQTHATFEASRSNLTITGKFLDALTYAIGGPGQLSILWKGSHPQYWGQNGPIGRAVANSDLAKWLAEKGFKVFDNSLKDNATIKSRIGSIVRRYLRRGLRD